MRRLGDSYMVATAASSFKQKLLAGLRQIGIGTRFCSPVAAEALGFCGFDDVYADMEHSPNDQTAVLRQSQALAGTGAQTVVRLRSDDAAAIQGLLDIGIGNLVVPMVGSAGQARRVAAAALYPPRGVRNAARFHRGNRYGNLDFGATRDGFVSVAGDVPLLVGQARRAPATARH